MTTPKLQLPELVVGQSGKELTHNQALAILSQLTQANVIDKDLTAPPGSPADGAMYLVAASATSAWAGKSGQLAFWLTSVGAWTFAAPVNGWRVWVTDESAHYTLKAGVWTIDTSGGGSGMTNPMTTLGDIIVGGASGTPVRLAKGTDGQVLKIVSGVQAWAAESVGLTNPMTAVGDLVVGGTSGTPSRLAASTSSYVLTSNGAGVAPTWQASSGGGSGLASITEAKNIAAPNAAIPAVSLSVTVTEASADLVLAPKGAGAIITSIPDSLAVGGNKRGTYAVDLQTARASSAQVASGQYSAVLSGYKNKADAINAVVVGGENNACAAGHAFIGGGLTNAVYGAYAVLCGGNQNRALGAYSSVGGGAQNTADGSYSTITGGALASTRSIVGAEAYATGSFYAEGQAQRGRFVMFRGTNSAAPTRLSTGGAAHAATNQAVLPNSSAYFFTGKLICREDATGDCAAWEFKGVIKRGASAAATALVATVAPVAIAADSGASAWSVSVTADTTLGGLAITVTGGASRTLRWVADVETVEVVL